MSQLNQTLTADANVATPAAGAVAISVNLAGVARAKDDAGASRDLINGQSVRIVTAAGAITGASSDSVIVVNKTVGAATVFNLPASPATGQQHIIKDGKGDAATNNITLTPAAGTIDGAATFVMNVNRQSITVVYSGTEWTVI